MGAHFWGASAGLRSGDHLSGGGGGRAVGLQRDLGVVFAAAEELCLEHGVFFLELLELVGKLRVLGFSVFDAVKLLLYPDDFLALLGVSVDVLHLFELDFFEFFVNAIVVVFQFLDLLFLQFSELIISLLLRF